MILYIKLKDYAINTQEQIKHDAILIIIDHN